MDYAVADLYQSGGMELPAAYRVSMASGGGRSSETDFNALGEPVARRSAGLLGATVFEEFGYDVRNRLVAHKRPHLDGDSSQSVITYGYDALDRLVEEFYPGVPPVHYEYALRDNVDFFSGELTEPHGISYVRSIDPRGNVKVEATNRQGQRVAVIDALGERTRYTYGAFDQLERITDPADRTITFVNDAWGRVTSVSDAARGGAENSVYNGLDEVVHVEDAAGRTQEFFYDDFGRLNRLEDVDGVAEWIYDGDGPNEIGRIVETVSSTGQRKTFGYEPPEATRNRGLLNRVTEHLVAPSGDGGDPRELVTAFHFDQFSRVERIDYPGSSSASLSVQYEFDAGGNAFKATNPATSDVFWEILEADQGYRIHKERLGSHTCGSSTGTLTTRTYEQNSGRVSSIQTTCGSNSLQHLSYGYDDADNVASRTDHRINLTETFGYDALNRLIKTNGVTTHSYDPKRGRLMGRQDVGAYTYEADGRDWIASAGNPALGIQNFEHDDVGNVTERSGSGVPGGVQTLDYTAFDLPKVVTTGTGTTASVTQFAYDTGGTRAVKEGPSATTYYANELYQRTETGDTTQHRFLVYAGGRAVAQVTRDDSGGSSNVRALHDDLVGSVQTISEQGTLAAGRDYAPFGDQRAAGGLEDQVPYGFTGHESDTDLGLINMKGRIYDPHLGQFLSADPIVSEPSSQGLNRFAYVNNSPLNHVDPTGLYSEEIDWHASDIQAGIAVGSFSTAVVGGAWIASGGLSAIGSGISTAFSALTSTPAPALGHVGYAMNVPKHNASTHGLKVAGGPGKGFGQPARHQASAQDYSPKTERSADFSEILAKPPASPKKTPPPPPPSDIDPWDVCHPTCGRTRRR